MGTLAGTGKKLWIVHCAKVVSSLCDASIITTIKLVNRGGSVRPSKIWGAGVCWSAENGSQLVQFTFKIQIQMQLWKFEALSNVCLWKREKKQHSTPTQLQGEISLRLFFYFEIVICVSHGEISRSFVPMFINGSSAFICNSNFTFLFWMNNTSNHPSKLIDALLSQSIILIFFVFLFFWFYCL